MMRRVVATVVLCLAASGCGERPINVALPPAPSLDADGGAPDAAVPLLGGDGG